MSIGAGAIRAGLAVVELSADLGPLDAALNTAAARLKGWSGRLAKIGAGVAGVGMSIAGPILAAFHGAVAGAASMDTLATQLSTTTEKASALAYALGTVGIGEEELVGFAKHLNNSFSAAASNVGNVRQEFAAFGVNIDELMKLPFDERLISISESLKGITLDFDRSNKAAELFGRRGLELLKLPAGELRKRMAEAYDVGAVVSPEQAAQAKEIQRSFAQIASAVKYAFLEVGRALLPHHEVIKEYAKTIVNVARGVREWVSENKPLVTGVLALGAGLTAAGAALVALGVAGAAAAGIVAGLGAVAGVVGSVVGAVFTPVGAALAIVAAGGVAAAVAFARLDAEQRRLVGGPTYRTALKALPQIAAEGKKAWGTVKESAVEAWGGIASAMKRGDIRSAWAIVVAGGEVAWLQLKGSFLSVWGEVRDSFLDEWEVAVESLKRMFLDLAKPLAQIFGPFIALAVGSMKIVTTVTGVMLEAFRELATKIASLATRFGGTALAKKLGLGDDLLEVGMNLRGFAAEKGQDWAAKHIEAAKEATEAARQARAEAREEDRAKRDEDVRAAKDRLKAILEEEKAKAGLGGKGGPGGEGGGFGSVQQAAREVRGTFGVGFSGSASAQQALAVGSTPVQRQLVETQRTNTLLEQVRDKIEGPPAIA